MDLTISAVTMATIATVFALAAAFKLHIFPGPVAKRSMSRRQSDSRRVSKTGDVSDMVRETTHDN
jgi:hypothetical protein